MHIVSPNDIGSTHVGWTHVQGGRTHVDHPTARRNFVFCGDVVPRLAGNTDYVMSVLDELQKESQENAMHNILSTLAKPFFDVRKRIAAGVQSLASEDGDLTFLGQYKHLSQLIYYQEMLTKDDSEYKYECDLLSAEAFAGIKITDESSETGGWVGTSWSGPSRWFHNPKSRSTKEFKTVADYLKDVHTVLPYASECSWLSTQMLAAHNLAAHTLAPITWRRALAAHNP